MGSLCVVPFGRPLDTEVANKLLDGRSLIAFDVATGKVKWTVGEDQISYASPVLIPFCGVQQIRFQQLEFVVKIGNFFLGHQQLTPIEALDQQ